MQKSILKSYFFVLSLSLLGFLPSSSFGTTSSCDGLAPEKKLEKLFRSINPAQGYLHKKDADVQKAIMDAITSDPALTPSIRKNLFRIAIDENLPWTDEALSQLIDLKIEEVSAEIYPTVGDHFKGDGRFGKEMVWAMPEGMVTFTFRSIHQNFSGIPFGAGKTLVDIGAGFGKIGLYLAIMYPGTSFVGYELVPERVVEFKRVAKLLGLPSNIQMHEQNLADPDFRFVAADYYYAWSPVNAETGAIIWKQLEEMGQRLPFSTLIFGSIGYIFPESRGFVAAPRVEGISAPIYHSPEKVRRQQR